MVKSDNLGQGLGTLDDRVFSPNYHFWESEVYTKACFTTNYDHRFKYYDTSNIFKFLFFHWVANWTYYTSSDYVEPYKLPPLPVSDQILRWQPIFSKNFSDDLLRLDGGSKPGSKRSVLFRAFFLTFGKRGAIGILGIVVTNILSLNIAFLVKYLLKVLNTGPFAVVNVVFILLGIIVLQVVDVLLIENFRYYLNRLSYKIQFCVSTTALQHGLSYRRRFFNNINGSNALNVCNKVLHSCSNGSSCSENPLFCPARRYQNKDITPQLFVIDVADSYHISVLFFALSIVLQFVSNFVYGIILLSFQIKVNLWLLYVIGFMFFFIMVIIEVVNAFLSFYIFRARDYKISKCNLIIPSISLISKTFLDDIATNIITEARNKELLLLLCRIFLLLLNRLLYTIFSNMSFYILTYYFVKTVKNASVITDIDTAGFMTTFYTLMRIIDSMFLIPLSLKELSPAYISFIRLKKFLSDCSPNFYVSDNKYTGSTQMSYDISPVTDEIDKDVVVLYKDASFTWVNNGNDLLNTKYDVYLHNVNFELKRGEIAIVTGSQGSGKSNFIKSVLGEMSLVGGSMAVVPLHTSMPIFYASQDIWLQQGTIRSNITFGYRFDEVIYNSVIRAVELEFDIATWENGDLREVSDNAYSLSGGQRVRMEMARAIYAYLIFSKVNKEYNSQCSFLMCLDATFHGLDPFVSKTVFNNLFNVKSGLLVSDDLSVILSATKVVLEKCVGSSDLANYPDFSIYQLDNGNFKFHSYLSDFIRGRKPANFDYFSAPSNSPNHLHYFTNDMFKMCFSHSYTRAGRRVLTKSLYDNSYHSIVKQDYGGVKLNPFLIYAKASGFFLILFIIIALVFTILDDIKFVIATNLSDYITRLTNEYKEGNVVNFDGVKSHSSKYLTAICIIVSFVIILSIISTIAFTISSITASRSIHEYCINSIFQNNPSVLRIQNIIKDIISFLACDVKMVDDDLYYALLTSITSLIETLIHIVTLFYSIPLSIPFVTVTMFIIYQYVFIKYINSVKNLFIVYLESITHNVDADARAITGSSIYRSFKKEWEIINNHIEHTEYKMRPKFLVFSNVIWASTTFNWIFSLSTFVTLVAMIIFDNFTKYKMRADYFVLALSLSMSVIKSFTKFSLCFLRLNIYLTPVRRFQLFIPPKSKCKFLPPLNIHEEDYVLNGPTTPSGLNPKELKHYLLNRRKVEFRQDNKRFYSIRKLFFKPKINLIDVTQHLPPQHSGVELEDVCVYTSSPDDSLHNGGMILNNITVSAKKSDIIGIIGRTGAGKTTLLSVLQNTVHNRTGSVLLDGKDLKDIPTSVTHQIIGVLPQLPFVFRGWTIRRFLDPRKLFTDEQINEALEMCGLLDLVKNLPGGKGLDSVVIQDNLTSYLPADKNFSSNNNKSNTDRSMFKNTDNNDELDMLLSNSQLRTLSVSRLVLYRHFYRMILVDEPPENLDCEHGESVLKDKSSIPVYELLQKYFTHCTTFVTAHNSDVLKNCTRVWAVHNGKLIRTCKSSEVSATESISKIIEQVIKEH